MVYQPQKFPAPELRSWATFRVIKQNHGSQNSLVSPRSYLSFLKTHRKFITGLNQNDRKRFLAEVVETVSPEQKLQFLIS